MPFESILCFGLSTVLVGVIEEQVRSLANELVDDSFEIAVRHLAAAAASFDALPSANSRAIRPFPGTGGGFSSIGTIYDSMTISFILNTLDI